MKRLNSKRDLSSHLNAIAELTTVKEVRPASRLIQHKPWRWMNIYREIRNVTVLQKKKIKTVEIIPKIQQSINKILKKRGRRRKSGNLKESTPKKIKRNIAANEEQESDFGRTMIESLRNSNWGFGRIGVKSEESSGD